MCELLLVSTSGFYAWLDRPPPVRALEDSRLAPLIRDIFRDNLESYGTPRIKNELQKMGEQVSRARIGRLMKQMNLVPKAVRRKRTPKSSRTTSGANMGYAPNLLERNFEVSEINKVWTADITYIDTRDGWLYLATVMDLCSRMIVGWEVDDTLEAVLATRALKKAVISRCPKPGLIHHSDRGSQYASDEYQQMLKAHSMKCSMSGKGQCWDNAPMESFFDKFKVESELDGKGLKPMEKVRGDVVMYIEGFYNKRRTHSALGYKSPSEYEECLFRTLELEGTPSSSPSLTRTGDGADDGVPEGHP